MHHLAPPADAHAYGAETGLLSVFSSSVRVVHVDVRLEGI